MEEISDSTDGRYCTNNDNIQYDLRRGSSLHNAHGVLQQLHTSYRGAGHLVVIRWTHVSVLVECVFTSDAFCKVFVSA